MLSVLSFWPQVIVHIDGDAFFASVEQAVKPYLKGKPVVTGKERNIVAAASYEARRFGVNRGVTLWDAKKMCPDLIVLPTDYETVSIFSGRMFDIMRRFTPAVEEYSIDEGFCDLGGTQRVHRASYPTIARRMQEAIHHELGITVSVGISVSKTLAKIGSKLNKPAGFTSIPAQEITNVLQNIPVGDVWNIGPSTAALLRNHGYQTAGQFIAADEKVLQKILSKPGLETWHELRGESTWPVSTTKRLKHYSISKTRTFTPPSSDKNYVWAQLMKNVENACMKARRYKQMAQLITVFLKKQNHSSAALQVKLSRPVAHPPLLVDSVRELFDHLFESDTEYRATGIILSNLTLDMTIQPSLFDKPAHILQIHQLYTAIDELRDKYGKYTVQSAASLPAQKDVLKKYPRKTH